jgi:hypothetical protein
MLRDNLQRVHSLANAIAGSVAAMLSLVSSSQTNVSMRTRWLLILILLSATGCTLLRQPSNDRNWSPDQAVLPSAEFSGSIVRIHNIRNCKYRTAEDYTVNFYDKDFDLGKIQSVDFVMVPFSDMPGGAHTFLSFCFEGNQYVDVSVEVRKQKGETYSMKRALIKPYELMYVVGDERDLIQLRTNHWLEDVYVYRAKAAPQDVGKLFVDVMQRTNQLKDHPEFYRLLSNNCTTNIRRHVNDVSPSKIPYTYQVLLPGYSDKLAYELGLIDNSEPFERVKLQARVNALAYIYRDDPEFSTRIREEQAKLR